MMLAGYGFDSLSSIVRQTVDQTGGRRQILFIALIGVGIFVLLLASTYQEPSGPSLELLPVRFVRGSVWFAIAAIIFYLAYKMYSANPRTSSAFLLVGVIAIDLVMYAYPQIYQKSIPAALPYVVPENFPRWPRVCSCISRRRQFG